MMKHVVSLFEVIIQLVLLYVWWIKQDSLKMHTNIWLFIASFNRYQINNFDKNCQKALENWQTWCQVDWCITAALVILGARSWNASIDFTPSLSIFQCFLIDRRSQRRASARAHVTVMPRTWQGHVHGHRGHTKCITVSFMHQGIRHRDVTVQC